MILYPLTISIINPQVPIMKSIPSVINHLVISISISIIYSYTISIIYSSIESSTIINYILLLSIYYSLYQHYIYIYITITITISDYYHTILYTISIPYQTPSNRYDRLSSQLVPGASAASCTEPPQRPTKAESMRP